MTCPCPRPPGLSDDAAHVILGDPATALGPRDWHGHPWHVVEWERWTGSLAAGTAGQTTTERWPVPCWVTTAEEAERYQPGRRRGDRQDGSPAIRWEPPPAVPATPTSTDEVDIPASIDVTVQTQPDPGGVAALRGALRRALGESIVPGSLQVRPVGPPATDEQARQRIIPGGLEFRLPGALRPSQAWQDAHASDARAYHREVTRRAAELARNVRPMADAAEGLARLDQVEDEVRNRTDPRTATGEDLDRLARQAGLRRRLGWHHLDGTVDPAEDDISLRARLLAAPAAPTLLWQVGEPVAVEGQLPGEVWAIEHPGASVTGLDVRHLDGLVRPWRSEQCRRLTAIEWQEARRAYAAPLPPPLAPRPGRRVVVTMPDGAPLELDAHGIEFVPGHLSIWRISARCSDADRRRLNALMMPTRPEPCRLSWEGANVPPGGVTAVLSAISPGMTGVVVTRWVEWRAVQVRRPVAVPAGRPRPPPMNVMPDPRPRRATPGSAAWVAEVANRHGGAFLGEGRFSVRVQGVSEAGMAELRAGLTAGIALEVVEPQPPTAPPPWWRRALAAEPLFDRARRWWRDRQAARSRLHVQGINRALVTGQLGAGTSGLPIDEDP